MGAIFSRELKSYFKNVIGYVVCAFILLFVGIYTMALCLKNGYPNFEYVLSGMSFVFLIVVPLLTMRVIADERRQKTDQLLYSLPLSMTEIVLGKYFAMAAVLFIPMAITSVYPIVLSAYGTINFAQSFGTILGFFVFGSALISIGMFISSLTENQVLSAVICLIVMFINYFLTDLVGFLPNTGSASLAALLMIAVLLGVILWLLTKNLAIGIMSGGICAMGISIYYLVAPDSFTGLFPAIIEELSLFERFYCFLDGVFDITSLVYFLSVIVVFIFLTVQSLEKRRYS